MAELTYCAACGCRLAEGALACVRCFHRVDKPVAPIADVAGTASRPVPARTVVARIDGVSEPIVLADGTPTMFGRMAEDDRIGKGLNPYDEVSRLHCFVTVHGGRVEVRDSSTRGTAVGGRALLEGEVVEVDLPVDVRLAGRCTIRVEYGE